MNMVTNAEGGEMIKARGDWVESLEQVVNSPKTVLENQRKLNNERFQ